jgi:hypothetical protein
MPAVYEWRQIQFSVFLVLTDFVVMGRRRENGTKGMSLIGFPSVCSVFSSSDLETTKYRLSGQCLPYSIGTPFR